MTTIEQAQKIADLRQRMLNNIAQNKPAHEGITEEELTIGIELLRQNRAISGAKGGKARAKKAEEASAPTKEATASLDAKLKALGLDLD